MEIHLTHKQAIILHKILIDSPNDELKDVLEILCIYLQINCDEDKEKV